MIECRYCREVYRMPLEKIGARCPACRMPLFEKDRQRPPVVDLGPCAVHKDNSAAAKCSHCGKMMCTVCRTRWDDDILCVSCLDRALQKGEMSPRQVQTQKKHAVYSLILAVTGWAWLFLTYWPMAQLFHGIPDRQSATFALILFFGSFIFALFAMGLATACLRVRGPRRAAATCGLSLAGMQLGICLGLLVLNIWHH